MGCVHVEAVVAEDVLMLHEPDPNQKLRFFPVFLILPFFIFSFCGKNDPEVSELAIDKSDSKIILGNDDKDPRIPLMPRRRLSFQREIFQNQTLDIGLKTEFLGSTVETKTNVTFEKKYIMSAWMFASGEKSFFNDSTSVEEMNMNIYLNNKTDRPFTLICNVSAFLYSSKSLLGKLSIFGSGLSDEIGIRENTEVMQSSPILEVPVGDSWPNQIKRCEEYALQAKKDIDQDLLKATTSMMYHNPQDQCVADDQCQDHHRETLGIVASWTNSRCVMNKEGNRFCALRSIQGGACPYYKSKTRLTSGQFEFKCDQELRCQVIEKGGWFQGFSIYKSWKAECK